MKISILIIISMMLCGASCEKLVDHVYSIKIQNNSTDTIQFYANYSVDTSLANEKPRLKMVYPSKYSYLDSKEKWEDVLPNNTIIIFILSKDTVDTYSWDKIRSDYNILRRYDLSIEQLKAMNSTITYP